MRKRKPSERPDYRSSRDDDRPTWQQEAVMLSKFRQAPTARSCVLCGSTKDVQTVGGGDRDLNVTAVGVCLQCFGVPDFDAVDPNDHRIQAVIDRAISLMN
jgi:hypothetical protein